MDTQKKTLGPLDGGIYVPAPKLPEGLPKVTKKDSLKTEPPPEEVKHPTGPFKKERLESTWGWIH